MTVLAAMVNVRVLLLVTCWPWWLWWWVEQQKRPTVRRCIDAWPCSASCADGSGGHDYGVVVAVGRMSFMAWLLLITW